MPDHYCYKNAPDWASKHPEGNPVIVHGTVVGGPDRKTMGHAWLELDGEVADPTIGVRLKKEDYYKAFEAKPDTKYTEQQALVNMVRNRHYGPWTKQEAEGREIERIAGDTKPERITQAAIGLPEHTVTGFSHAHARDIATSQELGTKDEIENADEGFVTSHGRFVDRKEALKIARKAKQVEKHGRELISEDLIWDGARQTFYSEKYRSRYQIKRVKKKTSGQQGPPAVKPQ